MQEEQEKNMNEYRLLEQNEEAHDAVNGEGLGYASEAKPNSTKKFHKLFILLGSSVLFVSVVTTASSYFSSYKVLKEQIIK